MTPVHAMLHSKSLILSLLTLSSTSSFAAPGAISNEHPQDASSKSMQVAEGQREGIRQGGIGSLMKAPLVDDSLEEGTVWVRTRTMRTRFTQDGGTLYPAFGKASPQEWPLSFDIASVTVGGEPIDFDATDAPHVENDRVVQPRVGLTEVHHLTVDGIEQTFVFDELPGGGDVVLRMSVETELIPVDQDGELRFQAPGLGHVSYGEAFALDANGKSISIDRVWTGMGIEFRIPSDFVASAELPLTIDPFWTSFTSGFGVADDADPTVLYAGATNQFLVVWNEYTSAQNLDVYATRYSSSLGTPLEGVAIEMGNDSWVGPACAYVYGADRALIAAVRNPGAINSAVLGRLYDVGSDQLTPGSVLISTTGTTLKSDVDVGGTNFVDQVNSHFCVTWAREISGESDVEYRILEADGSDVTSVLKVSTSDIDQVQPAIAQGAGDTDLNGDIWHIVWTEDNDGDGRGSIEAVGIHASGLDILNIDPFSVTDDAMFSHPAVSSVSDAELASTGERAAVIAFERAYPDITSPTGFQTDLLIAALSDGEAEGFTNVTLQEDFDRALQQRRPAISTNGKSFYLAYLEEDYDAIGSGQWDVYLTGLEIVADGNQPRFALGERHVLLEDTAEPAMDLDIFSRWEGENNSTSSRCLCVWAADLVSQPQGFGQIRGAGYQYLLPQNGQAAAVGSQYGDANPNSGGASSGRQSSWMRVIGTGQIGDLHTAEAVDLPANAFAYLLVGTTFGDQNNPGGSAGRLCISGSVGRFIGQVQSSGAMGTVDAIIDPMALPQPNGSVAAFPGQAWYFQFWHRDSQGGQPTSNFTNACAVRFEN